MKSFKTFSMTAAVLLATSVSGFAADLPVKARPMLIPEWANPILVANNQVTLDIVGNYLDYYEFTPAFPVLDSERGWQPGVQVSVSAMGNLGGISNLYAMGQFTYASGKTRYFAAGGPVTSNTDGAEFKDFDARFGKGFDFGPNFMITPYIGVGYHVWDRDLSNRFGPFGYHERYEHGYVGGGLMAQWAPTRQLVFSASGLVGTIFDPRLVTSFNGGFVFPGGFPTFTLGERAIYKAGLSADYAITQQWHVNVGADYTRFNYGRSPVVNGFLEPDSRTSSVQVKAGVGYSFYAGGPVVAKY